MKRCTKKIIDPITRKILQCRNKAVTEELLDTPEEMMYIRLCKKHTGLN